MELFALVKKQKEACSSKYSFNRLIGIRGIRHHNQKTLDRFLAVRYAWISEAPKPTSYPLFHAMLYALAEEQMIESLSLCCLHHLKTELQEFHLMNETAEEVLRLIHFAFAHRSRQSFTREDKLRKLVVHYTACKLEFLLTIKGFRALMDNYGELGYDLILRLHS